MLFLGYPPKIDKPKRIIEQLSPSDVMIDVGANVGVYANAARCRVYAFEPAQKPFRTLLASVEGNPRYSVYNFALSDHEGRKTLYIQPRSGTSSFTKRPLAIDEEDVPCRTLDSFVSEYGVKPTFIKIDVEGHQMEVLRGGLETIKKWKPILLIEGEEAPLSEVILPLGYTIEKVNRNNWLFKPQAA